MSARILKREPATFGSPTITLSYQQAEQRQLFKYHVGMVRHFAESCEDRDEARRMHAQLCQIVDELAKKLHTN